MLKVGGAYSEALAEYRTELALMEALLTHNPSNPDWQRFISVVHEKIGSVLEAQGDLSGALRAYQAMLAITERLAQQDPGNAQWQRDLAISHERIGDVLVAQGDLASALVEYQAELAIAEPLVGLDPDYANQIELVFNRLISTCGELMRYSDAVRYAQQWASLIRQQPVMTNHQQSTLASALGHISWYYLLNRQFIEAKAAAEEGYSLDQEQVWVLTNLAHAEMFLGHLDAAMNIYAQHANDVIMLDNGSKTWREAIADDFAAFRKAGLESPHMAAAERLMAAGDQN